MSLKITFRGMEHSPVIEEFVRSHIEKVTRILKREPSPVVVEFILEAARTHHHHRAEVILSTPHYNLVAHHECPDMYLAIEHAIDKMFKELSKAKEKRIDFRKKGNTFKGA